MEQNDSLKLNKLYEIYEQPMYRIAFAVLHDRELAEDAVSDAFMRIIGKLGKLEDPESPRTRSYIVRVIKSTAVSIYRKNKRTLTHELPMSEDTMKLPDPFVNVEESILSTGTDAMLRELNEKDRRIVLLRCRDELPWKEVAAKMSLTEAAARKRFERAKKQLIRSRGENYDEV